MAIYFQGKKISRLGALTEPSTYDADITPENMQRGMTAYAQGKKVIGTGKAFEFAEYGRKILDFVTDENGNDRYGFYIETESENNIIFLSSTADGDALSQEVYVFGNLEVNKPIKIGTNLSKQSDICIFREEQYLCVYFVEIENIDTQLNYFIAKDNKI